MRNLEDIEKDLSAAREALSNVEGTPAEVYSRIVGYYRSVRNWNRGKREEYGERRLYLIKAGAAGNEGSRAAAASPSFSAGSVPFQAAAPGKSAGNTDLRLLLFVRASCPACPSAKAAAGRLGIPVETVNADTADGITEAVTRNVMSTPTAILLSPEGEELGRAKDAETISGLLVNAESAAVAV